MIELFFEIMVRVCVFNFVDMNYLDLLVEKVTFQFVELVSISRDAFWVINLIFSVPTTMFMTNSNIKYFLKGQKDSTELKKLAFQEDDSMLDLGPCILSLDYCQE